MSLGLVLFLVPPPFFSLLPAKAAEGTGTHQGSLT